VHWKDKLYLSGKPSNVPVFAGLAYIRGEKMSKNQANIPDVWDIVKETQKMATNHAKLLMEQYKTMKGIYGWPNKMLTDLIAEYWPNGTARFFEAFDIWFEQTLKSIERNIEDYVEDYAKTISGIKFTAPNADHYRMLVGEHTKLWIENYKKLIERREQISQESLNALKKMLPIQVHPILDNANDWIMKQSEVMDREIINRVEKFSLAQESDEE
jgi:hypothetical protein